MLAVQPWDRCQVSAVQTWVRSASSKVLAVQPWDRRGEQYSHRLLVSSTTMGLGGVSSTTMG